MVGGEHGVRLKDIIDRRYGKNRRVTMRGSELFDVEADRGPSEEYCRADGGNAGAEMFELIPLEFKRPKIQERQRQQCIKIVREKEKYKRKRCDVEWNLIANVQYTHKHTY